MSDILRRVLLTNQIRLIADVQVLGIMGSHGDNTLSTVQYIYIYTT